MSKPELIEVKTRTSGQVVFVIFGFVVTLILLSQIGAQTQWNDRARSIAAQPRFWPAVALMLMAFGFGAHWRLMQRRRPNALDWIEVRRWAEPLEFLGYRTRGALLLAVGFALAITAIFKGLLGVNIPGGQIYNALPGGIRTFFLVYL